MKRALIILLSVLMLVQLCGCNQSAPPSGFQATTRTVFCPSCSAEQNANAVFCQNCGNKLSSEIACGSCGKLNSPDASFCGGCGISLSGGPVETFVPGETGGEIMGASDCLECAYAGLDYCEGHDCILCEGNGYNECYAGCYGGCSFCDGGYVDCSCDNGKVYFNNRGSTPPSGGNQACNHCENGYVTCSLCGGSGRSGSYTVGGFDGSSGTEVETLCNKCFGAKKTACIYCGADGEL